MIATCEVLGFRTGEGVGQETHPKVQKPGPKKDQVFRANTSH